MKDQKNEHNKYYYEQGRNGWTPTKTWKEKKEFNMKRDKYEEVDYSKEKIPNYYIGNIYGYEARKVVEDFDLSYNIGTATTYLLRASRKHSTSVDCIQKAINHLEFELDKINNEKTNL
jgi:lysozyme family protein